MVKNMKIKMLTIVFLLASGLLIAGAGAGSIDLLKVPSGVRTQSMGGADIAVSDDPEGIDANPAGLALIRDNQFMFIHDLYIAGISFDSVYYAHGIDDGGTITGLFKFLSAGTIKQTNETTVGTYAGEGADVSAMNFLAGAAYSVNLSKLAYSDFTKNMDIGAALKFSGESIGSNYMNMAVSADLGAIYTIVLEEADFLSNRGDTIWNKIGIGAAIRNLGTSFGAQITPMSFTVGGYTQILGMFGSNNRLRINTDVGYSISDSITMSGGFEFLQLFGPFSAALRLGGNFCTQQRLASGLAAGLGFGMKTGPITYTLDYVFVPYSSSDFGSSQKVGLGIKF
jgi:hypothetical protein